MKIIQPIKNYLIVAAILSMGIAQDFSASVNVAGGAEGTNYDLTFGFSPNTTDGYDDDIDFYAPPPPPSGFDAALMWGGDRFYTQILLGDGELSEHIYDIALAYDTDNLINIVWDNTGWSNLMGSCVLQDAFGGLLGIDIDMLSETTLTLDNPAFSTLKLKVTPNDYSLPNPNFTVSDTTGAAGSDFSFTDISTPGTSSITGWTWDFGDGDSSNEQNPIHVYDSVADYTVGLTVTDENGFSRSIIKVDYITVNPAPPVADAGPDQNVNENDEVTLDGSSSSDPDGEIVSYLWTAPPEIVLDDVTSNSTFFTAPEVDDTTDFTIILTVTDNDGQSMSDSVVITINNVLIPPTADAGVDSVMDELTELPLDWGNSNDTLNTNGLIVSWLWTVDNDAVISFDNGNPNSTSETPTITASEVNDTTDVTISLTVTDNDGDQSSDDVIITVNNVLFPPVANAGEDGIVDELVVYTLNGSGSNDDNNPNGSIVSYLWAAPAALSLDNPSSVSPSFTAPEVDEHTFYTITLTVMDNDGQTDSDSVVITVNNLISGVPVADAGEPQTVNEETLVILDGTNSTDNPEGTDPDGTIVSYNWVSPPEITLDNPNSSTPSFTAPSIDVPQQSYSFTLTVIDNNDPPQESPEASVVITILNILKAPVPQAGEDIIVNENLMVQLDGSASVDSNGTIISHLWTAPSEIVLDNVNSDSTFFIAPEVDDTTDFTLSLTVTDNDGQDSTDFILITVNNVLVPPIANAGADTSIGELTQYQLDGSDSNDDENPNGSIVSYSWTSPPGITLNNTEIPNPTFTAPEIGVGGDTTYAFSLTVVDNDGQSDTDTVHVEVLFVNQPPVASAGNDITYLMEGTDVLLRGDSSSDPDGQTISYQWSAMEGFIDCDSIFISDSTQVICEGDSAWVDSLGNGVWDENEFLNDLNDNQVWDELGGFYFSEPNGSQPRFFAPQVSKELTILITLITNDGGLNSDPDTVGVTIINNTAPIANAGPDQEEYQGNLVYLTGGGSEDDTDVSTLFGDLTYQWITLQDIILSDNQANNPSFTAPEVIDSSSFHFVLTVNDGEFSSDPDTVTILVIEDIPIPIANAGSDQPQIVEGNEVTLEGGGSSENSNAELVFSWVSLDGIVLSSNSAEEPRFYAPLTEHPDGIWNDWENFIDCGTDSLGNEICDGDTGWADSLGNGELDEDEEWTDSGAIFRFTLSVSDGENNSAPDTVEVTVITNAPPTADAGNDDTVYQGETVTLTGDYDDETDVTYAYGDVQYHWTAPSADIAGNLVTIELSDSYIKSPSFIAPDVPESASYYGNRVQDLLEPFTDCDSLGIGDCEKVFGWPDSLNSDEWDWTDLNGNGIADIEPDGIWNEGEEFTDCGLDIDSTYICEDDNSWEDSFGNGTWDWDDLNENGIVDFYPDGDWNEGEEFTDCGYDNDGNYICEGDDGWDDSFGNGEHDWEEGNYESWVDLADNFEEWIDLYESEVWIDWPIYRFILVVDDREYPSAPDTVSIVVKGNDPPIANAGNGQKYEEGSVVQLDASGSSDINGDELTYHWTTPNEYFVDCNLLLTICKGDSAWVDSLGNGVWDIGEFWIDSNDNLTWDKLEISDVAKPEFVLPVTGSTEYISYTFTLVVNDGEMDSEPNEVVIEGKVNEPPSFTLVDLEVDQGDTIALSVNADDDFTESIDWIYSWFGSSAIVLNGADTEAPSFIAPDRPDTSWYSLILTIGDGDTVSAPDTMVITVLPNKPPFAIAGVIDADGEVLTDIFEVDQGTMVTLDGTGSSDPNNDQLSYEWVLWSSADPEDLNGVWNEGERWTDLLVNGVWDDWEDFTDCNADTTICEGDPAWVDSLGNGIWDWNDTNGNDSCDVELKECEEWTDLGNGFYDLGEDWIDHKLVFYDQGKTVRPTFTAPDRNEVAYYVFYLVVNDIHGLDSEPDNTGRSPNDEKVTIKVLPNKPPVADAGDTKRGLSGNRILLNASGSRDPNNDPLSYSWTSTSEEIVISDPTEKKPSFILPETVGEDRNFTFILTVSDDEGKLSEVDSVTITAVDNLPAAPNPPNLNVTSDHGIVNLTWDKSSELSLDPFAGYADFEGYRVYRSTDGGNTWGDTDDKIFDYNGNFIGWKPLAQYDLTEEQDSLRCLYSDQYSGCEERRGVSISGFDPLAQRVNLGSNKGLSHSFTDSNIVDGIEYTYVITAYDMGLRTYTTAYFDDDGDGIFRDSTIWSNSNPLHYVSWDTSSQAEVGFPSLESPFGTSSEDPNYVQVIPGYYASNITFPDPQNVSEFIVPGEHTFGNGNKFYTIVEETNLTDALYHLEIQAELIMNDLNGDGIIELNNPDGNAEAIDTFEGLATENPTLFIYEITDTTTRAPVSLQEEIPWSSVTESQQDSLLDLPGAGEGDIGIQLPEYKLDAFPLRYLDDVGYRSNWTDFFDGIRLRFDNAVRDQPLDKIAILSNKYSLPDSGLIDLLDIELKYTTAIETFLRRPAYSYRIDFGTGILDTANYTAPIASGTHWCEENGFPTFTFLPFRITNLTTGKHVPVWVTDKGPGGLGTPDVKIPGYKDCIWQRDESISFKLDTIKTMLGEDGRLDTEDDALGYPQYTFNLKIDFIESLYYLLFGTVPDVWESSRQYGKNEYVFHHAMVYTSTTADILPGLKPSAWYDPNGDDVNDNPWQMVYPWQDGDYIIIEPTRWYVDGDSWTADLSKLGESHAVVDSLLETITVVPNPYLAQSRFESLENPSHRLRFTHLPQECRISIFTMTGELVRVISHLDEYNSNEWWDLTNGHGQFISPGLYIYVVETPSPSSLKHIGKFVVVR